jgi:hypothetical protein
MLEFAAGVKESQEVIIEEIGPFKYVGKPLGRGVVVLCTESVDEDDTHYDRLLRLGWLA